LLIWVCIHWVGFNGVAMGVSLSLRWPSWNFASSSM
jgi:hypothetical protein